MKDYKEEILDWLRAHTDDMLSDISTLIRINSEKMDEEPGMPYGLGAYEALTCALDMAEGYGFSVKSYDGYVGCCDLNDKEKQLDILAHLDVVPVTPENWTVTAPFEPVVRNGCLYGRGSSDDKGPAVAALYAMRAVKELGIPLRKNVRLILGTDEECGSSDIEYYYRKEEEAPMTFSPDAEFPVINLEKGHFVGRIHAQLENGSEQGLKLCSIKSGSKFNVIPGDCEAFIKGLTEADRIQISKSAEEIGLSVSFDDNNGGTTVCLAGKSGHAASPELALNALTATLSVFAGLKLTGDAGSCIRSLAALFPHGDYAGKAAHISLCDEISGSLTCSLDMLSFDGENMSAVFDIRFPVCGNRENIIDVLSKELEAEGLSLEVESFVQPHYVPEDSEFIKALLKSYELFKDKPGRCVAIGGGTYVHNLKNGVAFGPVELDTQTNLHGNDENIPVEELVIAAAIYAEAIILLCS